MSEFKLYPFQQADVDRVLSDPTGGAWNASVVGTGKTPTSTAILNELDPTVTLIVAPPNTYDGWARAQRLQGYPLGLRRLSSHKRDGQAVLDIREGRPGRYFTSYEFARQYSFRQLPLDAAIFDECFIAGTPINTPTGLRTIESLRAGDTVWGFDHVSGMVVESVIKGTMTRTSSEIVGSSTASHPYYVVDDGYRPRADVTEGDKLYAITTGDAPTVRDVWANVLCDPQVNANVRDRLSREAASAELHAGGKSNQESADAGADARSGFSFAAGSRGTDDEIESGEQRGVGSESAGYQAGTRGDIRASDRRERQTGDNTGNLASEGVAVADERDRANGKGSRPGRVSNALQVGSGMPRTVDRRGVRRAESSVKDSAASGREEGQFPRVVGMDDLAILEPRDPQRYERVRSASAGSSPVTVYNLETETSNYFAESLLVHNCHRFSDKDTATYQLCKGIGDNVRERGGIRLALSGTPGGNKIAGMWGVLSTLWEFPQSYRYTDSLGAPIGGAHGTPNNFYGWAKHHLNEGINEHAMRASGKRVPLWGRELEPGSVVRELPLYWRHEQNFACCDFHPEGVQKDLPARVVHPVEVDMSPAQAKIYAELESDMFAWIEGSQYPLATEGYPMQHWLRLMQVSLAVPTTELAQRWKEREDATRELVDYIKVTYPVDTKSSKLDAVDDIMKDIPYGERVLILTHSAGIIPAVLHRLAKAKINAAGWFGGVGHGERARIKASFIDNSIPMGGNGSGAQVIVAQIGAIGEGVDGLQWACSNEIWISQSSNRLQNTQALGRLRRDGQKSTVNSWQIAARNTKEMEQLEKMADESAYMTSAIHAQPSFAETFLSI